MFSTLPVFLSTPPCFGINLAVQKEMKLDLIYLGAEVWRGRHDASRGGGILPFFS
jgi:hypothetical protein